MLLENAILLFEIDIVDRIMQENVLKVLEENINHEPNNDEGAEAATSSETEVKRRYECNRLRNTELELRRLRRINELHAQIDRNFAHCAYLLPDY